MKNFVIGVTGASGAILAVKTIELLLSQPFEKTVLAVITEYGEQVFQHEAGRDFGTFAQENVITVLNNKDMFAPIASGSFAVSAMIIVPCSMSTCGKIASGAGGNLLCRAADVCLKEKNPLVLAVRESPLNLIHLKNLTALCEAGAIIAPCVPAFYAGNQTIEQEAKNFAARLLKSAGVDNSKYKIWGE
ncbi:aromatic acid decarboxylase [Clostridia bacterium]|nr:aromatic acid decarboxylase [Clostridia bacterium]